MALGATDIVVGSENSYCWGGTGVVLGWCGVGSYRYCSGQSEQLLLGRYWGGVALEATDIVVGSENSYCWEFTGVV